jgi:hypothetical protein
MNDQFDETSYEEEMQHEDFRQQLSIINASPDQDEGEEASNGLNDILTAKP